MSDPVSVSREVLRHRHSLLAYIRAFIPDPHAVEDVFQEVSLVAIQKAAEFRDDTNFPAWVRTIARFKIQEQLRARRGVALSDALFDGMENAFTEGGDLDDRKEALRRCLGQLPEKSRQLLAWRYADGLDPAGIAGRMRQTRTGVNSLLQRLRESLRDCLARQLAAEGGR